MHRQATAGPTPDAEAEGPPIGPCAWNAISNLRLYLPLDGPGATAMDLSGLAHGVTVQGGASTVPGRVRHSMRFNGNDLAVVTSSPDLEDMAAISVCAWIFLDQLPVFAATIIDKSLDGRERGWNFYVEASTGQTLGFLTRRGWYVHGGSSVPTKTWVHTCATWDGSDGAGGIRLYRNGQPDAITGTPQTVGGSEPMTDATQPLVLGRQSTMNMYNLVGRIDELYLFAGVLTAADVTELYSCAQ
jgi:hypothetical protein